MTDVRPVMAVVIVLVLSVFASGSRAQNSPTHQHAVANVQKIDGARTPELIPDNVAFRLWLVTASTLPNPSVEHRNQQAAHLAKIQFSNGADYLALVPILTEFKSQYNALIKNYNDAQTALWAKGIVPDPLDLKLFLQQRDDLVAQTRATLARQLSPGGNLQLTAHIQSEKAHMQLHVSKEGQ